MDETIDREKTDMDDLDEFMTLEAEEFLAADENKKDQWKITSKSSADWCLSVIKRAEAEIAEAKERADERKQRIDEWANERKQPIDDHFAEVEAREKASIERMESKLRDWTETYLIPEGLINDKKKTYSNLQNGTVGFRKQTTIAEVEAGKEEELIKYLRANVSDQQLLEELIKTTETVRKDALKKAFPPVEGTEKVAINDDEVLPFVIYPSRPDKFAAKTR